MKWHEITVEDWIEIQELINDDLTASELALELELYFNENFDDEITASELRELRTKWAFIYRDPPRSIDAFDHLPFKKMLTHVAIDLETYLTKYKLHEVIEKIIPLLFGEVDVKHISQVHYAIPLYLKYRKELIESYGGLFGGVGSFDEDEGEIEDEELEELEEIDPNTPEAKWGWLAVVYNMANGDITKTDAIMKKTFISVLNWASMRRDFESRPPK